MFEDSQEECSPRSGMTADHLFPFLESEADSELLVQVASKLAVVDVPEEVIDGIRFGDELTRLARLVKPTAVVWRSDTELPVELQGVRLFGVPIGSPYFVRQQLEDKSAEQDLLFHRIPLMEDTSMLAFLFVFVVTRANFWLCAVHRDQSRHDTNVWRCMRGNCHSRWEV